MSNLAALVGQEDYGYINARIRAMKSLLLSRDFYDDLFKSKDFSSLMSMLEKTPYKLEIQECAISHSGVDGIDEALKRNLSRTFRKILSFVGGKPRDLILIFLGRWDLHNIITIMRGIHIESTVEQILDSLVPAGELSMPLLSQLANEKSVKGLIDVLVTWNSPYAKMLSKKLPEYQKERDLSILELVLQRTYYADALSRLIGKDKDIQLLKELLIFEIDAINMTTILRLQRLNLDEIISRKKEEKIDGKEKDQNNIILDFYVPGGNEIKEDKFIKLCLNFDVEKVIKNLERTSFKEVLKASLSTYLELNTLSILERKLEEMITLRYIKAYYKGLLDIGIPIGYIWKKYNEVVNLRIIIRCKQIGMPDRKIKEEMLIIS